MKVQKYINQAITVGGYWYRCSRVEFTGDTAKWELGPNSRYSFFEAYEKAPHNQLIKAEDDVALRSFVKAWGPLRLTLDAWIGNDPIESYRFERDQLRATVQVLASVEEREMQRLALTQLFEVLRKRSHDQGFLFPLRQALRIPGDLQLGFDQSFQHWLESATPSQIESAMVAAIPMLGVSPLSSPRFFVDRSARHHVLRADLGLHSIGDALNWMVWQDVFQDRPYQFCAECRKVFQPEWRHKKKFCSDKCAHRKTAREWKRKRDNEERKTNGTQETR